MSRNAQPKSISIVLDSTGSNRVKYDGNQLNFSFQSYRDCLSFKEAELEQLKDDCKIAFTSRSIDSADENYSSGSTFFLNAGAQPRCYLENLAMAIFRLHTKDAVFDATCSGAEWWTQVIDSRDDIGWHWDRDYGLEEDQGLHIHPHLATVTYLSDCGGPTIVLNKKGTLYSHEDIFGPVPDEVVISRPLLCKHISFDGRLLHAAPSDDVDEDDENDADDDNAGENDERHEERDEKGEEKDVDGGNVREVEKVIKESGDDDDDDSDEGDEGDDDDDDVNDDDDDDETFPKRVTFLVNIWLNHTPVQSKPFPAARMRLLQTPTASGPRFFEQPTAVAAPIIQMSQIVWTSVNSGSSSSHNNSFSNNSSSGSDLQRRSWKFTEGDDTYRVSLNLPAASTMSELAAQHDAFRLVYAGSDVHCPQIDCITRKKRRACVHAEG